MSTRSPRTSVFAVVPFLAACFAVPIAAADTASTGSGRGPGIVVPDRLLSGRQGPDAPIEVRFVTAPDAAVDLASLRIWVLHSDGWVDMTGLLLRWPGVRVGGWGIHIDGGLLPAGEHQVRVSFHDVKGRAVDETKTIRIAMGGNGSF